MAYLSEQQIQEMASAALTTYDFTGSWIKAKRSAYEHCGDEYGVTATQSQIRYAVKLARIEWDAEVMHTKRMMED